MNILSVLLIFVTIASTVQSKELGRLRSRDHGGSVNGGSVNKGQSQYERRDQEQVIVTVDITFDSFPPETGWSITDDATDEVVAEEPAGTYQFTARDTSIDVTLNANQSYTFTIADSYGDGLCCVDPGTYSVSQGSNVFGSGSGNFGFSASISFTTEAETMSTPTPAPGSMTPAQTPGPTPAQTPGPTPAQTPGPTPAQTPGPTPAQTPGPTPAQTPAPTPAQTPGPTPAQTPGPTPGPAPTDTPVPAPTDMPVATPLLDIVDTANASNDFPTLVLALLLSEVAPTLKGDGPFTVFAPSEGAFANLPEGTMEFLLSPENKSDLQTILLNHVVNGSYVAADLMDGQTIETFSGDDILISVSGASMSVNNATVITADIMATNGVIHAIDSVLVPDDIVLPTVTDSPVAPTDMPVSAPTDAPVTSEPTAMPVSGPGSVTVNIMFDDFAPETGWSITLTSTNEEIAAKSSLTYSLLTESVTEVVSIERGEEYTFTITDAFGDGMSNGGTYEVLSDQTGVVLASGGGNFGAAESTQFIP